MSEPMTANMLDLYPVKSCPVQEVWRPAWRPVCTAQMSSPPRRPTLNTPLHSSTGGIRPTQLICLETCVIHWLAHGGKECNWPIQDQSLDRYPGPGRSLPVLIGVPDRVVHDRLILNVISLADSGECITIPSCISFKWILCCGLFNLLAQHLADFV